MFRMEFKPMYAIGEDDGPSGDDYSRKKSGMSRSLGSDEALGSKNWMQGADLIELVAPVILSAEAVNVSHQPNGSVLENGVFVTYLDYQPVRCEDMAHGVETVSSSSPPSPALLEARNDSMRSTSSSRSDSASETEEQTFHKKGNGSPASAASNRTLNKLSKKTNNSAVHDDKFAKPLKEPLLAAHEQAKVNLKAQKKAKIEAERLAEEERREWERQQRELRDLANCATTTREAHKGNGIHKLLHKSGMSAVYRFFRNPFSVFRSRKEQPRIPTPQYALPKYAVPQYADARRANPVMPRASVFSECSSTTDATLAQIRLAPGQQPRRNFQFATVESTQRDVEPWTREEYMRKNGRLREWNNRKNDEEFGAIEGNNLMNQYFDDDLTCNTDSDSD